MVKLPYNCNEIMSYNHTVNVICNVPVKALHGLSGESSPKPND